MRALALWTRGAGGSLEGEAARPRARPDRAARARPQRARRGDARASREGGHRSRQVRLEFFCFFFLVCACVLALPPHVRVPYTSRRCVQAARERAAQAAEEEALVPAECALRLLYTLTPPLSITTLQ